MSKWTIYTGSDEQIKELNSAIGSRNSGVLLKLKDGTQKVVTSHLYAYDFSEYLICNPHPLADMICQQARTGQPVWWRAIDGGGTGLCHKHFPPFAHPDTFEYSFTEFKEEV